ncbi:MAG: response regulator [Candidatus Kapabacteria bacterium]|nr:response regulator [Ignavibacteriota bacterium]MCW5885964.1 response regulator [Candidatus Kapabacteria bacterium]
MTDIKMLIVDDEPAVLISLSKIIEKAFPEIKLQTARNGNDGWSAIKNFHPQIVLSDISMPGYNGIELLNIVRNDNKFKDIYFVIMTAHDEEIRNMMNMEAAPDDFITKPVVPEKIIVRIKAAKRLVELQSQMLEENKLLIQLADQLETEVQDMIKLAVKFLEARIPASVDNLKKVAEASVWIAKSYGDFTSEQIRDIEIAAYLSQAGRIFLNDSLLKVPVMASGRPSNEYMFQVPKLGRDILSSVRRFDDVSKIVYHIYENFDGSGIPDRMKSWQIPFESRIIRVALDYQEIKSMYQKTPKQAIEIIKTEASRLYDQRVTVLMEHYIKSFEASEKIENEIAVQLTELNDLMKITRDVYTEKGLKLLPAGATLSQNIIKKIIMHNTTDPILGNIYVKRF